MVLMAPLDSMAVSARVERVVLARSAAAAVLAEQVLLVLLALLPMGMALAVAAVAAAMARQGVGRTAALVAMAPLAL